MEEKEMVLDEELALLREFIIRLKRLDKINKEKHRISSKIIELDFAIDKLPIINSKRKALKDEIICLRASIPDVDVEEERKKIIDEIREKYESKYQYEGLSIFLEQLNIEISVRVLQELYCDIYKRKHFPLEYEDKKVNI